MLKKAALYFSFVLVFGFIFSCTREDLVSNENFELKFSNDTITFDTVFTTIGSTTQWLRVINPSKKTINIGKIMLAGGSKSPFKLNIDGKSTNSDNDLVIEAGDSIYIFVQVTVDPTNSNNPMVIKDSIIFQSGSNMQDVKLIAFGQDFHLYNGEVLKTQKWINDKPYLIYNSVLVDSLEKLTIDAGCRVYFHKKSSLFVYGTIEVNGTVDKPVTFQGDRLEKDYENIPGQWGDYQMDKKGNITRIYGGIHFLLGSRDNFMNYAVVKNANIGIQADSLGSSGKPMLTISNTKVQNMSALCLDARSTEIKASNCIFANSGSYAVALLFGGSYEFNHCTIANYYGFNTRNEPSLLLQNFYDYDKTRYVYNQVKADFNNCIVYGSNLNELQFNYAGQGMFNYNFKNCLIRTDGVYSSADSRFKGTLFNKDPRFKSLVKNDFAIDSLSPAKNTADLQTAKLFPLDLMNNSRLTDEGPDIGAVEWVPVKKK